jgi:hypothetical protein
MQFAAEINIAVGKHGLDPWLVGGIIRVESNFTPWAWNPEPAYRYLWNVRTNAPFRVLTVDERTSEIPPKDFPCLLGDSDQEWWGQQSSWGLMQIMGAVARQFGFKGPYLPELCTPEINLNFGGLYLSQLLSWAKGDVDQALAAWNGGKGNNGKKPYANQAYATKVIAARYALKEG